MTQSTKDHPAILEERAAYEATIARLQRKLAEMREAISETHDLASSHAARADRAEAERDALAHDIARHVAIAADLATDCEDLRAQLSAAEIRARESALDALAAYGQAAEAHEAQLAAEQRLATARGEALEEAARVADGYTGPTPQAKFDQGYFAAARNIAAAIRALAKGGS